MAATWAVLTVLTLCPCTPQIVTDCLGILDAAKKGTHAASAASFANARLWRMIARRFDGDVSKLGQHLVWMPAHQGQSAIGTRVKSNGRLMTSVDFRANRLVDKLALHFAPPSAGAAAGRKLVASTKIAASHR